MAAATDVIVHEKLPEDEEVRDLEVQLALQAELYLEYALTLDEELLAEAEEKTDHILDEVFQLEGQFHGEPELPALLQQFEAEYEDFPVTAGEFAAFYGAGDTQGGLAALHELTAEEAQMEAELASLLAVARILAQPISFQEKCRGVLEELVQVAGAGLATMRAPADSEPGLRLAVSAGPENWIIPELRPLQASIPGATFQQGQAAVVNAYATHPLADPSVVAQGVQPLLSLPIKIQGHTVGVVEIASGEPDHFTAELAGLLTALGERLGTI